MTDPVDRAAVLEVVETTASNFETLKVLDAEYCGALAHFLRALAAEIKALPSLPAGEVEHYEGCPERDGVAGCCVCDEMPAIIRPFRATPSKDES